MFLEYNSIINGFLDIILSVFLIIYVLFSLIVVRQVSLMSKVILTGVDKYVKTFVFLHLIFSVIISIFITLGLLF